MAGLLINLNQLETSMRRIKAYCDTNYSLKNHTHDDNYYTKLEFDNIKDMLLTKIESKSDADHVHTSENIAKMTGYVKPADTSAITTSDTLNSAIGKLEKALDNVSSNKPNYDDTYLKINATAAAAKKLESPRQISLGGAVNGSASFDGSSDITIATTISNLSSDKVTSLTGYAKPDTTTEILVTDSLNSALGKLEKALEGKQNTGDYALREHNHNDSYYTKQEVVDMISEISAGGSADLVAAKK